MGSVFVDECRLYVAAGRGGDGAVSFHREKYKPRGGPDGGNGGRGGSVILAVEAGAGSLRWLRDHPHQRAMDGTPGHKNNRTGKEGEDLILPVPPGTVVKDEEGILADLAAPGDQYVIAAGGRGGRGNAAFLSDHRRAPGFGELGEPGVALTVHLELRLIADVAVIGLPNAGKSTLVGALSAAAPLVGAYPFTTLEPTLGRVTAPAAEGRDELAFTICDVPGLIEGAHEGKGLGLGFLRHAARALALLHLVDVSTEVDEPVADPLAGYQLVRNEVSAYSPGMAALAEVVALNKVDLVDDEVVASVAARFRAAGIPVLTLSAAEGQGLDDLVAELAAIVARQRDAGVGRLSVERFRTDARPLAVTREDQGWRLSGTAVERWVAMCDLANPEAVSYLQQRMERAGVESALAGAGAEPGDEVRIGDSTFEWFPTTGAGAASRR